MRFRGRSRALGTTRLFCVWSSIRGRKWRLRWTGDPSIKPLKLRRNVALARPMKGLLCAGSEVVWRLLSEWAI